MVIWVSFALPDPQAESMPSDIKDATATAPNRFHPMLFMGGVPFSTSNIAVQGADRRRRNYMIDNSCFFSQYRTGSKLTHYRSFVNLYNLLNEFRASVS